jgi:hypothetical protein
VVGLAQPLEGPGDGAKRRQTFELSRIAPCSFAKIDPFRVRLANTVE